MNQEQPPQSSSLKRAAIPIAIIGIVVLIAVFFLTQSGSPSTPPPALEAEPAAAEAESVAGPTTAAVAPVVSPLSTPLTEPQTTTLLTASDQTSPVPTPIAPAPVYAYQIVNTYPHDPEAFTQGLVFSDGIFYEGTGLNGQSSVRKVEPETGEVLQRYDVPEQYFAEGITIFDDRIIQLTWQTHVGFVYDKESFTQLSEFEYPTEGWGLTHDGTRLIMSDGTATLYFRDPETLAEIGRVDIFDENGPVINLNELEYLNGEVYATVWRSERIARIDPDSGQVVGWIDLSGLLTPEERSGTDVLNGIAYDAENDRLFVTGKWWPKLFEIKVVLPAK
jgi:glutamine cyclotransferase